MLYSREVLMKVELSDSVLNDQEISRYFPRVLGRAIDVDTINMEEQVI